MKASELKPGDRFKIRDRKNGKIFTIMNANALGDSPIITISKELNPRQEGMLLFILMGCRQLVLPPDQPVYHIGNLNDHPEVDGIAPPAEFNEFSRSFFEDADPEDLIGKSFPKC